MKRVMIIGALVLLVGLGAGAYYLFSNLDSLVAAAIEKHGSEATGTHVGVSGVDISLREGRGSIHDLEVDSPQGFQVRQAMVLAGITIDLDVSSVRGNPLTLEEIHIAQPRMNAELLADGTLNLDELRKHVQSRGGAGSEESGPASDRRIRIERLVVEEGVIEVDATAVGVEKRTVTLPGIRMNDVGGENGVPPDQVARIVLTRLAREAVSEIGRSGINRLIEDKLEEGLGDKARDLIDRIGN